MPDDANTTQYAGGQPVVATIELVDHSVRVKVTDSQSGREVSGPFWLGSGAPGLPLDKSQWRSSLSRELLRSGFVLKDIVDRTGSTYADDANTQEQPWVTREEMARHCPACAEQMAAANVSRIALRDEKAWAAYAAKDPAGVCASLWAHGSEPQRAAFGVGHEGLPGSGPPPKAWLDDCVGKVGGSQASADYGLFGWKPGDRVLFNGEPGVVVKRLSATSYDVKIARSGEVVAADESNLRKPEAGRARYDAAPPTKFRAEQNSDGTWNLRGVPVFVEHAVRDKSTGKTYAVDAGWMQAAVERSQARYREDGYLAPIHENHHGRGREVKYLGKLLLTGVKRIPYQGKVRDVTFADYLGLRPEAYARIRAGELPYRSAEVLRLDAKEIDSLALLADEVPFFRLAGHAVSEEIPYRGEPKRFTADDSPLVACRAMGYHGYSLLMRYDDMPDELVKDQPPVVDVGMEPKKAPEKAQAQGLDAILAEIARLLQEAIEASKGASAAPAAEPSQGPAPVEPEAAGAMRSARNSPEVVKLQARFDALEARYSATEKRAEAERQAGERRGAVDKVFADLQRYGLGEERHRAKLVALAEKDGLPALHAYAAAVKEYAAEAPPSFAYIAGGTGGGAGRLEKPDPVADRYAALGPKAAELAYSAARSFDELARKNVPLGMTRDEFIRTTLESEGGFEVAAVAAVGG